MPTKCTDEAISDHRIGRRPTRFLAPTLLAWLFGITACSPEIGALPLPRQDTGASSTSRDGGTPSRGRDGGGTPSTRKDGGTNPSVDPEPGDLEPVDPGLVDPTSADCGTGGARYSKLPNGSGGFNLEQASYACVKGFDRAASVAAFETTLYPLLRKNCAGCHATETEAQAPILADSDVGLAHDYAITRTNFHHPEEAKIVLQVALIQHHFFGRNAADAAAQLQAATKAWADVVLKTLPDAPRLVAEGVKVSEQEVKDWVTADRAKVAAADAPFMVYVSAHEMHNAGLAADQLNMGRAALSKVLNSTARWAPKVVNPVDVNGKGMVYRFDIRDYWGYNKGVKTIIFGGSDDDIFFGNRKDVLTFRFNYAKTVSQDPDFAKKIWARVLQGSLDAPHQSGKATNIKGFKGDYVELSQLVYTLSRPDVYNAVMSIPCYADELEDELEIVKTNGENYQFVIVNKGITIAARQMFRASMKSGGYYWKSFDIFTGNGQVFPYIEHPLPKYVTVNGGGTDKKFSLLASLVGKTYTGENGVQQHASETFWQMPNGMQAFAIFGGLNQRRTDAFTIIVVDPRRARNAAKDGGNPRGELRLNNPASCFGCHEEGMKRENNDLRDSVDNGTLTASWKSDTSTVDKVKKLYPETKVVRKLVEDDHQPFLDGMLKIRNGMLLGEDKNLTVEPIVWVFEWAQVHYTYADTLAN